MSNPNKASGKFRFKQFTMNNNAGGLKIGTDGVLLGAWARPVTDSVVWDVGCGGGLIALMVAQRMPDASVKAIEIDREASAEARVNAANSPWNDRVEVVEGDIHSVGPRLPRPELIVSNPPYYNSSGAIPAAGQSRDMARRDTTLSFKSLIELSTNVLLPSGNLCMISPYDRKAEIEWLCAINRLFVREQTAVSSRDGKAPIRILWHISRTDGPCLCRELSIRDRAENFTDGYINLTKDYYLDF